MTPQLITCFEGKRYQRLAQVLEHSARTHCPTWEIHSADLILKPNDATKLAYWLEAIEAASDGTPLALMDCDALILKPLDDLWDRPFDIAITARNPKWSKWPNNAGILFVRASDGVRAFFRHWLAGERKLLLTTGMERKRYLNQYGAVSQAALEDSVKAFREKVSIIRIPCLEWNCEDSSWAHFDAEKTRILHIKGAFRNMLFKSGEVSRERRAQVRPLIDIWKRAEAETFPPEALYTPDWQAEREWTHKGSLACLRELLKEYGAPSSLLDLGCGDGALVRSAAEQGIESRGVDLSIDPANDGPLRFGDLREAIDLAESFGMVVCWEVAEHLPPESAETLCDTLARHVAVGGHLVFTAATPGQGGTGHINCQPPDYWRGLLEARGLAFDGLRTARLAKRWTAAASDTPWYGQNVQLFRRPYPAGESPFAVAMRTANRAPNKNYLGRTVRALAAQGFDLTQLRLTLTAPDVRWLESELRGMVTPTLVIPPAKINANQNGLQQVAAALEMGRPWVLLLEDDILFCADFLGSVERWIAIAERPNRHVYRFFGFTQPPHKKPPFYDHPLAKLMGSQAILLRRTDAEHFLDWGQKHLKTWRKQAPWGGSNADPGLAFDKFVAAWALHTWPNVPGVISHPYFVKHIGHQSSLHKSGRVNDGMFAGEQWTFRGTEAAA